MKKRPLLNYIPLLIIIITTGACQKSYITGGSPENVNAYANTLTYDVLKSNPLYDTLVQVIDAAGLKDQINAAGTTFFAPSDYSVFNYLNYRTRALTPMPSLVSTLYCITSRIMSTIPGIH
jgi:hypothetical protein